MVSQIIECDLEAFARQFHFAVDEGKLAFAFFLGAGCSVSSGIPSASTLSLHWIRELKRRETGTSIGAYEWFASKKPGFTPAKAGQFYATVIQELFPSLSARKIEIQRFVSSRDPGCGYGALAALATHVAAGALCNVVITTNFDDLIADALLLYQRIKPLIIEHDAMAVRAIPTSSRPLIMKVHGDALSEPRAIADEVEQLPVEVSEAMKSALNGRGLVFLGYSGGDNSILVALRKIRRGALSNGVFWVNSHLPSNTELREWLIDHNATWVKHRDFDEVMMALHHEFKLAHPNERRFTLLMQEYRSQCEMIERRGDLKQSFDNGGFENYVKRIRRISSEKRTEIEAIFVDAIRKHPRSVKIRGMYAQYLRKWAEWDLAEAEYQNALEIDPYNASNLCHYASLLIDHSRKSRPEFLEQAERLYREACRANPSNPMALGSLASFIWTRGREGGANEAEYYFQRALEADFTNPETLSSYANFLWRARNRAEEALDYYQQSVELNPASFRTLANYSQLLFIQGDLGRACSYAKTAAARSQSKILQLEANFYLYAHDTSSDAKLTYLQNIKWLIKQGVRSPDWDLSPTVRAVAAHEDKNAIFVGALSEVISANATPEILEQFRLWA